MDPQLLNQMIGVPFTEKGRDLDGWDCWGVVRWGLLHGFGIEVPSYCDDYMSTEEGQEIAALIARESLGWMEQPLHAAQPGDVLVLRIKGRPWHCGLVIESPWFLHAIEQLGTVRDRWDALRWEHRIIGLYRHPARRGGTGAHIVQ